MMFCLLLSNLFVDVLFLPLSEVETEHQQINYYYFFKRIRQQSVVPSKFQELRSRFPELPHHPLLQSMAAPGLVEPPDST